jgi:hypothetical protein
MNGIVAWLKNLLASEPAIVAWATGGGLAMLAAYVFHFTQTQEAAAATIVTGLAAIVTVIATKERSVTVVIGALTTIIVAAGAFGYHPAPKTVSVILAVASVALALLFRQNITPMAKLRVPERKKAKDRHHADRF